MATSSPPSRLSSRRLPRIGVPDPVRDAAATFRMQREPCGRRIFVGGGMVLSLVTVYLVLREPIFEDQHRIEKILPQVCTQLTEMEALGQEVRGLSTTAAAPVPYGTELE